MNCLKTLVSLVVIALCLPLMADAQQGNTFPQVGKVGVGTQTPSQSLEVVGTSKLAGDVAITKDLQVDKDVSLSGSLVVGSLAGNGLRNLQVDGNGKVVVSPITGTGLAWSTNGNTVQYPDKFGTLNAQPIQVVTNDVERMRITQDGEVRVLGNGNANGPLMDVDGWLSTSRLQVGNAALPWGYSMSVDGGLVCDAVLVKEPGLWPDYVFAPDYQLRSLAELDAYIKTYKHLPDLPSAEEAQQGVELAEMNRLLLQKVEELTLYVLELKREIDALKAAQE